MNKGGFPHRRHTGPMLASPRCGARTRAGKHCGSPAVRGKKRCRMHGGAAGSGAPSGNRNARKHGLFTDTAKTDRRTLNQLMRDAGRLIAEME